METPQQNGLVERKHQHILNITRSLLFHSGLLQCFWNYVAALAVHLINRIPSSLLDNKSPYYVLHDKLPDISHLRVFGSLTFASTNTSHRKKLNSKARKCIFLGYKRGVKGFFLYDLHNRKLFLSRHVHFYENIFPHKQSQGSSPSSTFTDLHSIPYPPHEDLFPLPISSSELPPLPTNPLPS